MPEWIPARTTKRLVNSVKHQHKCTVHTLSTHRHESVCCCHWRGLSGDRWSAPCPGPCHKCYEHGTLSSLEPQQPPCRRLQLSPPGEEHSSSSYTGGLMHKVYYHRRKKNIHKPTLKTRCFSLSVSNSVYMVLSMETTCIGVMWLQMRVNPTTSLKRMVTSGNTWEKSDKRIDEQAGWEGRQVEREGRHSRIIFNVCCTVGQGAHSHCVCVWVVRCTDTSYTGQEQFFFRNVRY